MSLPNVTFADLDNASVLITGGGSGIGAALTEGFARQGAKVAFIDINEEASAALVAKLAGDLKHAPLFLKADLRDVSQIKDAVQKARDAHGPIRVLINNAALDDRHDLLEVSEAYWDNNQSINLKPAFFTIQTVAPDMIAAGGGSIINFTSTSYMMNMGEMPSYTAAKAGIVGLTKGLAGRLGPDNIRVNTFAPGWVMTERQKALWVTEDSLNQMVDRQALKRPLEPYDMVGPCLFLASDAARMITAQVLIADGGVL